MSRQLEVSTMTHELDWKSVVAALAAKGYVIVHRSEAIGAGVPYFKEENK